MSRTNRRARQPRLGVIVAVLLTMALVTTTVPASAAKKKIKTVKLGAKCARAGLRAQTKAKVPTICRRSATTRKLRWVRYVAPKKGTAAKPTGTTQPSRTGGFTQSPSTTTAAPLVPARNIDRDAEIVISINGATATLDPHKTTGATGIPQVFNIYDRLLQFDVNTTVKPMVARSWEFSPDGKTFRLVLREDVKFNDGTPLKADAVKASLERAKTVTGSTVAAGLSAITRIVVVGDYELNLTLDGPAADLPAVLASQPGVIINPKVLASGADLALNPPRGAGSGPRVVQSFTPSEKTVYVRADEDYWDKPANAVAKMTILIISASAPRMNAFRAGQADIINIRPDQVPEAKAVGGSGGSEFYIVPIFVGVNGLFLRNSRSEFGKLAVRQALNYAVDRKAIAEVLNGVGVATQQVWPKGAPGHVDSLDSTYPMSGDQAKAKELLVSAGLPNGFSFEAQVVAGAEPYTAIGTAIQAQLAKINVNMKLTPIESSQSNGVWNAGNRVDAWSHIVIGQADPGQTLNASFVAGGNMCGQAAPECYTLAQRGRDQTLTIEQQFDAYKAVSKAIVEKAIFVPVAFTPAMWLANSKVVNVANMPMQVSTLMDPRYLAVAK